MAFPTKILLATDGSKDAALAAQAAIDLSNQSGAELHVVYVGQWLPYPFPDGVQGGGPKAARRTGKGS